MTYVYFSFRNKNYRSDIYMFRFYKLLKTLIYNNWTFQRCDVVSGDTDGKSADVRPTCNSKSCYRAENPDEIILLFPRSEPPEDPTNQDPYN
jgi:hypothetical protein